jgi:hypothetical protein
VFAARRGEAVVAGLRELVDDPFGVSGAQSELQAAGEPLDRGFVVTDVLVGEPGGVVEPDVVGGELGKLAVERRGLVVAAGE